MEITCPCGKKLKVREQLAGKRVRCPGCGEPLLIPTLAEGPPTKNPAAPKSPSGAPDPALKKRRVSAADEEEPRKRKNRAPLEDEDSSIDEDERPSKKKKKNKEKQLNSGVLLFVLLGAGALVLVGVVGLLGIGFGLGWFDGSGSGKKGPIAENNKGPSLPPVDPVQPKVQPKEQPNGTGPAKSDQEAIQGSWESTHHYAGPIFVGGNFSTQNRRFQGNQVFSPDASGRDIKQTFRINPAATPKEMDIVFDEGGPQANTAKWIYELNGDTLKLCCIQGPDQPRPKSFDEPDRQLIFLKRSLNPPEDATPTPSTDPARGIARFQGFVKRLSGRWLINGFENAKVTWEYRQDGTFDVRVDRTPPLTVTGRWEVVGIGKDSVVIERTSAAAASEFFQSNERIIIYFTAQDNRIDFQYRKAMMAGTRQP